MKNSRLYRWSLVFVLAFSFLLVACGGGDDNSNADANTNTATNSNEAQPTEKAQATDAAEEPTDAPEATEEPTEAPTEEPTEEPTEAPTAEPTEDTTAVNMAADFTLVESAEKGIAIQYPKDWFTDDSGFFLTIASDKALLDSPDPGETGAVAIVLSGPTSDIGATDPLGILELAGQQFAGGDTATVIQEAAETTVNDLPAATVIYENKADDGTVLNTILGVIVDGETAAIFVGATPADTAEEFTPVFDAMFHTIVLSEPVAPATPEASAAQEIALGDTAVGTVEAEAISSWTFVGTQGDEVSISVEPQDDKLDVVVDVLDESGASLLEAPVDNSFGTEEITGLVLPSNGNYTIQVSGFGDASGDYTISVSKGEAVTAVAGGDIAYGDTVQSSVDSDAPSTWTFAATAGDSVDITVRPLEDTLDAVVDVVDSSGKSILENGEVDDSFDAENLADVAIPADGNYTVSVRGFAGSTGKYELTLVTAGSVAPVETGSDSGALTFGSPVEGSIADGERVNWSFSGNSGDFVDITVSPAEDYDVVIDVLDANGRSLLGEELDKSYNTEYIRALELPEDGDYAIVVHGFDDAAGDYEITVDLTNGGNVGTMLVASDELTEDDADGHAFPFTAFKGDSTTAFVYPDGNETDVVLQVWNDDTDEQIGEDVDATTGFEELSFVAPEDGNYYFIIKGFDDGSGTGPSVGSYSVTLVGSDTTIFELAFGDQVRGHFGELGYIEYWLGGSNGDEININVTPESDTDVSIDVYDLDGNQLATQDSGFAGEQDVLTFTFGDEGLIKIRVTDISNIQGKFVLTIE